MIVIYILYLPYSTQLANSPPNKFFWQQIWPNKRTPLNDNVRPTTVNDNVNGNTHRKC